MGTNNFYNHDNGIFVVQEYTTWDDYVEYINYNYYAEYAKQLLN